MYKLRLLDFADNIICVNYPKMEFMKVPDHIKKKIYPAYMPMNPEIYYPKIPWNDRKKLFMYLGNILHHKMSKEFLQKVQATDISIDCYGKLSSNQEYADLFNSCKNVVNKGYVEQSKVADVMNEYKFFVMPHDGPEPFNIAVLQAMMCGTIPLVVNDQTKKFSTWFEWAKDLYYGNNTVDEFLDNLTRINKDIDISNAEEISNRISNLSMERFNYQKMKKDVQSIIVKNLS
jgi:glycosyltransferase involved in cell wall biosynthesis